VVPHTFLTLLGRQDGALSDLRVIPLVEPEAAQTVGLVVGEREPLAPLANALVKSAAQADVPAQLERLLPRVPGMIVPA